MLIPFSPPPGIDSDDTTFSATGRWADGNDVRFYQGKAETVGLNERAIFLGSAPVYGLHAFSNGGSLYTAYGYGTQLGVGENFDAPTNILASSLGTAVKNWSLDTWGENLLAVPRGGTLYEWTGTGNASAIANAPDEISVMLVDPVRRQVLAFGCDEVSSGTFNGLCFRCSDFEDNTDWTPSASNASDEVIVDGGGEFIAAKWLGDYFVAWTSTNMFLGSFVGDPAQTWRLERIEGGVGCESQDAVAVMDGAAYWLAPNRAFYRFSLGTVPVILPCTVSRDFERNYLGGTAPKALALRKRGEIWWFYCDNRDNVTGDYNTRYVAYSATESALAQRPVWFRGTHFSAAGERSAQAALDSPLLSGLLASVDGECIVALFNDNASTDFVSLRTVTATQNSAINIAYIQSADQYLDNSQRRMMIRRFIPDFETQADDVDLTLFVRDYPMSSATTKGPHTISTSTTKKDFRASGKIVAVKLSQVSGSVGDFRLGKPLFDAVPLGER